MTEADIQRQIEQYLNLSGCMVWRMNAGQGRRNQRLAQAGTPDLLALTPKGRYVWLEVKQPGGELRTTQVEMHKSMRLKGAEVWTVESVEQVKAVVDG